MKEQFLSKKKLFQRVDDILRIFPPFCGCAIRIINYNRTDGRGRTSNESKCIRVSNVFSLPLSRYNVISTLNTLM